MKRFFFITPTLAILSYFCIAALTHAAITSPLGVPLIADTVPRVQTVTCGPQSGGGYILCEDIPGINKVQGDFGTLFQDILDLAFMLAGTIIFIRIVYGGILYIISGAIDQKMRARQIFKDVAYGTALLMGSYLILNTINPELVHIRIPDIRAYTVPAPQSRLNDPNFERDYGNLLGSEGARKAQNVRDLQNNITLLEDELNVLQFDEDKMIDEDRARVQLIKNDLLPRARNTFYNAQRDQVQFEINKVQKRIDDLNNLRGAGVMGGGAITIPGTTTRLSGLTEQQTIELENLYEKQRSLEQQKQRIGAR